MPIQLFRFARLEALPPLCRFLHSRDFAAMAVPPTIDRRKSRFLLVDAQACEKA